MRKALVAVVAATALLVSVSACGDPEGKYGEIYKDAKVGDRNTDSADLMTFPDGFSNVASKCDGPNRVYVIYHGDSAYGSVDVVPNDPRCTS